MAAKSKKILVTTEKREIFVVRRKRNNTIEGFCPECQKEVELQMLDEATSKTGISTRQLFRLIENNLLHSTETTGGHLLICSDSLKKQGGKNFLIKKGDK